MKSLALALASLSFAAILSGCSTSFDPALTGSAAGNAAIQGRAFGGQQPIVGMHIYLYSAGTGGYGTASASQLVNAANTTSDGSNHFVTTDSNGFFSISGDYTCPTGATSYLYLYGVGGNAGGGVNSAATLMAPLGPCASGGNVAATVPYVWMNEVTTVVTAYTLAGWMADPLHLATDNTTLAQGGLATAFGTAPEIENIATGAAYFQTPGGIAGVGAAGPQTEVNTLANVLAACVNSAGPSSTACTGLFSNSRSSSGLATTDTATAIVNIAHNPTANVADIYALGVPSAPFQPTVAAAPNSWILSRNLTVPGVNYVPTSTSIASDGTGFIGYASNGPTKGQNTSFSSITGAFAGGTNGTGDRGSVFTTSLSFVYDFTEFSSTLQQVSSAGTTTEAACNYYNSSSGFSNLPPLSAFQLDSSGYLWAVGPSLNGILEYAGGLVGSNCLPTVYTPTAFNGPTDLAADASRNLWVANTGAGNLLKVASPGGAVTTYTDPGFAGITHVAVGSAAEIITTGSGNSLTTLNSNGDAYSECTGGVKTSIAVDGSNRRWMVNTSNQLEICPAGALTATTVVPNPVLSNDTGPHSIAIDAGGNVWVIGEELTEIIGAATPPVLPLATAAAVGKIGTRP